MKSSLPVARAFSERGSLMRHLVREPRVSHLRSPRRVHRRGYLLKAVALNRHRTRSRQFGEVATFVEKGRREKGGVVRLKDRSLSLVSLSRSCVFSLERQKYALNHLRLGRFRSGRILSREVASSALGGCVRPLLGQLHRTIPGGWARWFAVFGGTCCCSTLSRQSY